MALTTSTSGCLSGLPPLGTKPSYARVDVPDATPPNYRRWLPAQGTSHDDWVITYVAPGPFEGPVPEEFVARRGALRTELDYFGIGYENYDNLVVTNLATVIEAEFSTAAVKSTLAETGYEPDGTYREYDLYARSDVPRRAAVSDNAIVWTSRQVHDEPDLEATIDAGHGHVERYHEANDAFAAITEAVGASRMLYVGGDHPGLRPALAEIGADAFRTDDDAAYHLLTERYPPDIEPSVDRIQLALEDEPYELTTEVETADVGVDGRFATVEARVPFAPNRGRDALNDPPQVTWGASFDAEAQSVTLHHEAGEEIDADWLWYDVDFDDDYNEIEKEPLWPGRDSVGPGDKAEVDLSDSPDATGISVLYGTDGVGSRNLFTYLLGSDE
ncbi:hypothetical protein [Halopiger goleimassiliensis]|uniref:hypothetical protein n=1 Tax=Halopiger goleimassiliensis TaxID=1293048 RepID=UPI001E55067A|nr:hypothetical protein [Halopiger goleimassiliensis]